MAQTLDRTQGAERTGSGRSVRDQSNRTDAKRSESGGDLLHRRPEVSQEPADDYARLCCSCGLHSGCALESVTGEADRSFHVPNRLLFPDQLAKSLGIPVDTVLAALAEHLPQIANAAGASITPTDARPSSTKRLVLTPRIGECEGVKCDVHTQSDAGYFVGHRRNARRQDMERLPTGG